MLINTARHHPRLIKANTALFIAVGVFAAFGLLFGGGRKADVGRKDR